MCFAHTGWRAGRFPRARPKEYCSRGWNEWLYSLCGVSGRCASRRRVGDAYCQPGTAHSSLRFWHLRGPRLQAVSNEGSARACADGVPWTARALPPRTNEASRPTVSDSGTLAGLRGSDACEGCCEWASSAIRGTLGSVKASPAPAVEAMVSSREWFRGHTACCGQPSACDKWCC